MYSANKGDFWEYNPAIAYSWSTGATTAVINVSLSATYNVTLTSVVGCTSTASQTITASANPTVSVNTSTICLGSSGILTASGATTYSWSTSASTASVSISPTATAIYTVTGYNGVCSDVKTTTVNVNAKPSLTLTSSSNMICTSASGSNTIALTGTPAGGVYSGPSITGSTFNAPSTAGTYTATYTYTNSTTTCTNSTIKTITVSLCTGINEIENKKEISIYPNPNNGEFALLVPEQGIYSIINSIGQTIQIIDVKSDSQTISVKGLADGIYYVIGKTSKAKIVVSK